MGFEEFCGNRAVLEALRHMLARDRLPHALVDELESLRRRLTAG